MEAQNFGEDCQKKASKIHTTQLFMLNGTGN